MLITIDGHSLSANCSSLFLVGSKLVFIESIISELILIIYSDQPTNESCSSSADILPIAFAVFDGNN